jgi:hypothetical protein
VPYVPGSTDATRPLLGFEQPILPLEERQTLLFFRATCLPFMYMYPNNTRITTGKVRTSVGLEVDLYALLLRFHIPPTEPHHHRQGADSIEVSLVPGCAF